MSAIKLLAAVYMLLVAAAVAVNFIAALFYDPVFGGAGWFAYSDLGTISEDAGLTAWQILNPLMVAGVIMVLILAFGAKRRRDSDSSNRAIDRSTWRLTLPSTSPESSSSPSSGTGFHRSGWYPPATMVCSGYSSIPPCPSSSPLPVFGSCAGTRPSTAVPNNSHRNTKPVLENVLNRRRVILGAVGIVVALVLMLSLRCGGEETLTILYWQAPSTPNPYLSGGFKDRDAGAITLEPLAKYDPNGALVPALAEDIPTLQNGGISQDLTSITWNLKDDLKWSDGSDLTAHDVVFTWQYCTDEATGCTANSSFADITSVEALDNSTVKITFHAPTSYPYVPFVSSGAPVLSQAQFADCAGAAAAGCDDENFAPLGPGPYRIVEFTPDELAVYERNPHYYGDKPFFDRIILKGGGEALSAAKSVLDEGEADYAWNLQIDPDTLATLEAAGNGKVISAFSSLVERIVLNQTNDDPALGEDRSEYLDGTNPHPFLTFAPSPRPCPWPSTEV